MCVAGAVCAGCRGLSSRCGVVWRRVVWRDNFRNDQRDNKRTTGRQSEKKIIREQPEMIKFCQLDWDDNCLKHHENKRGIKTVSFNQARKPIYKTKIKNSSLYADYLDEFKKSLLINNKN